MYIAKYLKALDNGETISDPNQVIVNGKLNITNFLFLWYKEYTSKKKRIIKDKAGLKKVVNIP